MKYHVKEVNGSWYVGKGKTTYYPATKSATKVEADIKAIEMSARWHQVQLGKLQLEWEKLNPDHEINGWGDVLA